MVLPLLIAGAIIAFSGAGAYVSGQATRQKELEVQEKEIEAQRQRSLLNASEDKIVALSHGALDDVVLLAKKSLPYILIAGGVGMLIYVVAKK